jgi:hypothetical protein
MTEALALATNKFNNGIEAVALTSDSATYSPHHVPVDDWTPVGGGVPLPALPGKYGDRDSHVEMCPVVETLLEQNLPLDVCTTIVSPSAGDPLRSCA